MTHTLKLTNGGAFFARQFLSNGLTSVDDIYNGGSLSIKLKGAKTLPKANTGESNTDYQERIESWCEQPFGEIIATEDERDVLKTAIRTLSEKKTLPSNEYTVELLIATGLKEAPKVESVTSETEPTKVTEA